jgi:acyl-coenzyme A thioesterase PaaI-like protein
MTDAPAVTGATAAPTEVAEPEFEFDRATAARPCPDHLRFDVDVDPGWTVGPKPNGGYLLAVAARAAGDALASAGTQHRDPLAATAHYLHAPDPGPATVEVEVLRAGRAASQVRAAIHQDGRRCVDTTLTMGSLPTEPGPPWWSGPEPLRLAPYDECPRSPAHREGMPFTVPMMDRADVRLDPSCLGFTKGAPDGSGELRGWVSFADGRPTDPLGLLFFLDVFPPATFNLSPSGWVPTLSLTTYVRARPAPGPLRVSQRAQVVADDRVDEVCEIWDATDRLVAQATQLAGIRFEPGAQPASRRSAP